MNLMLPAPQDPPINLLLKLIDLIQHTSTPVDEREAGVHALNRVCGNRRASDIIGAALKLQPSEIRHALENVDVSRLLEQDEVANLLAQIRQLEKQNEELARRISVLAKQEAEEVRQRPEEQKPEFYPIQDFITALAAAKKGRSYGWKIDYVQATHDSPDAKPVDHHHIHKWQKDEKVPAWAYEQIPLLTFRKRVGKKKPNWTREEYQFLADQYNANPELTNVELARRCTEKFGREISENGIRGALHRANRMGLINGLRREMRG